MTTTASNNFKAKLAEIFMFDQADLDFGIYRIMNAKRAEIDTFLNKDLIPHVERIIRESMVTNRSTYEALIVSAEKAQKEDRARYLRERLNNLDEQQLQSDVFMHLHTFFARYYDKGDFISLRRVNKDAYAIPYSGEEVKLHWANADQYYIKSSEYFRDYAFTLADGRRVQFKLVDADTEVNNNKATANQERRFVILDTHDAVTQADAQTLVIAFTYMVHPDKQDQLNDVTLQRVETQLNSTWYDALFALDKNGKSVIENRLNDYTKRNTFDYFIHKNLGGFLRRELDFYVKNEMLSLDGEIDTGNAGSDVELSISLTRIRAFRSVGHKIITFLAQLENFQKKLWLKKKFVVETNYCVTLDRIPSALYGAIIANDAQVDEWVKLFAIDEIHGDLLKQSYTRPLTTKFLQENPFLVVDTKFFDQAFKDALLAAFDDIDEACDGLLVHSENFQALNLLQERYREQVKCIYIDPPYNTNATEIIYKNGYKDSSWCSLIYDRLSLSKHFLSNDGILCATIDDYAVNNLSLMIKQIMHEYDLRPVIIEYNHRGRVKSNFAITHEYGLWCIPKNQDLITRKRELSEDIKRNLRRTGTDSTRAASPKQFFGIIVDNTSLQIINVTDPLPLNTEIPISTENDKTVVWPIDDQGIERRWYYGTERVLNDAKEGLVWAKMINGKIQIHYHQDGKPKMRKSVWTGSLLDASTYGSELLNDIFGLGQTNFSFPKSIHAVVESIESVTYASSTTILDYFAGSGTTGHAVINLNREDDGRRKYILVEMGEYFNTVTKPRIQKVVYSAGWKNGKPEGRAGSSHMFKYLRLESYEDALNNVQLHRTPAQQRILDEHDQLREEYTLGYMLDVESRDSASLLNQKAFKQPFEYVLDVAKGGSVAESVPTTVDLVETFNYLIGLRVRRIRAHHNGDVRIVAGHLPDKARALVVWRNTNTVDDAQLWQILNDPANGYGVHEHAYDVVYVNGDTSLASNLPATCQVRHIDAVFHDAMFAATANQRDDDDEVSR